jgi:predicted nucleic acid-binding protein
LETFPGLPFSVAGAKRCAQLRETLHKEGKRIKVRALDLMTAAIALEKSFILVIRNVEDYKDIRGLKIQRAS